MTIMKKPAAVLILAFGLAATALPQSFPEALLNTVVPPAEARVGRPLTPVSVAGVGRRTVRRCAVGVYDC